MPAAERLNDVDANAIGQDHQVGEKLDIIENASRDARKGEISRRDAITEKHNRARTIVLAGNPAQAFNSRALLVNSLRPLPCAWVLVLFGIDKIAAAQSMRPQRSRAQVGQHHVPSGRHRRINLFGKLRLIERLQPGAIGTSWNTVSIAAQSKVVPP